MLLLPPFHRSHRFKNVTAVTAVTVSVTVSTLLLLPPLQECYCCRRFKNLTAVTASRMLPKAPLQELVYLASRRCPLTHTLFGISCWDNSILRKLTSTKWLQVNHPAGAVPMENQWNWKATSWCCVIKQRKEAQGKLRLLTTRKRNTAIARTCSTPWLHSCFLASKTELFMTIVAAVEVETTERKKSEKSEHVGSKGRLRIWQNPVAASMAFHRCWVHEKQEELRPARPASA